MRRAAEGSGRGERVEGRPVKGNPRESRWGGAAEGEWLQGGCRGETPEGKPLRVAALDPWCL